MDNFTPLKAEKKKRKINKFLIFGNLFLVILVAVIGIFYYNNILITTRDKADERDGYRSEEKCVCDDAELCTLGDEKWCEYKDESTCADDTGGPISCDPAPAWYKAEGWDCGRVEEGCRGGGGEPVKKKCNEVCMQDSSCIPGLVCYRPQGSYLKYCRNPNCQKEETCTCPVTPTPNLICNDVCERTRDCPTGLVCATTKNYGKRCRNPDCGSQADCICKPTGTPTLTPTSTTAPTRTPTPTVTPIVSSTPTATPIVSSTPTATPIVSNTPGPSATNTPGPSATSAPTNVPGAPTSTPTEIVLAQTTITNPPVPVTGMIQSFMYLIPALIIFVGLIL